MDCIPPGSSVHGILQARILEWAAMPSSRGSSQLRDWTLFSGLLHWLAGSLPLTPSGNSAKVYWLFNLCKTFLSAFHVSINWTLIINLCSRSSYYYQFTDEETEVENSEVSHSLLAMTDPGLEPGSFCFQNSFSPSLCYAACPVTNNHHQTQT